MKQEKWALISVYNKGGITDFAERLAKMGWKILSSGGTAKKLREAGIEVKDVADWVGGEEILGHKVVTLSREVHAALLADPMNAEELQTIMDMELGIIDLVCCDFYPLRDAIENPPDDIKNDTDHLKHVIEKTDIGGPTMVRSGAKGGRIVICRFEDRLPVLEELENTGEVSMITRQELRARAEFEVLNYCLVSARYHGSIQIGPDNTVTKVEGCGRFNGFAGKLVLEAKYGENALQAPAGFYMNPYIDDPFSLANFKVVEGDAPSYNNLCDLDRLLQTFTHTVAAYCKNFGVIPLLAIGVKHGNPCGAAFGKHSVIKKMITGDGRAIFGGLVMCNSHVTAQEAEILVTEGVPGGGKRVLDAVIAPSITQEAIDVLKRKTGRCRVMVNPALGDGSIVSCIDTCARFRQVRGGFLVQPNYTFVLDFKDPEMLVTGISDTEEQENLLLAWAVGCTSNSNTITIVKDCMLIGNGVGQQDRVGAAELAIKRARDAGHEDKLRGAVAYSDSFFPFQDAVQVLIDAGITAIFSTTGSRNDEAIQAVCKANCVTLYQLPDKKARGFFGH